jgi:hypothetical protein
VVAELIIEIFGTKQLKKIIVLVDGIVTIVFPHELRWQHPITAIPSCDEYSLLLE